MNLQIIERDGSPEWAVIPYADYLHLLARLEDIDDGHAYDQAKADLETGRDELIPVAVVDRLSSGESPLRVWREYRGLTQQVLAEVAGLGKSYISQLETGAKTGTIGTLRALAAALQVDVDDLAPWSQE
jgi:DNA-binding XRE family transcriptional regulator